jgi:hypothetical protein
MQQFTIVESAPPLQFDGRQIHEDSTGTGAMQVEIGDFEAYLTM